MERVLAKLAEDPPRRAALLAPAWPAQVWWPRLLQSARSVRWLRASPAPPVEFPAESPGYLYAWSWVMCRF